MPEIGETKTGKKHPHIWQACIDCGEERWVAMVHGKALYARCFKCAQRHSLMGATGEKNRNWKGGRAKTIHGYIIVYISQDDFFYPMHQRYGQMAYILEHRLIMAKHLNRCLLPWELVHHKNGIKDDNQIENLELLPTSRQHLPSMKWQAELAKRDKRIEQLEARLTLLEAENTLLRLTPAVRY